MDKNSELLNSLNIILNKSKYRIYNFKKDLNNLYELIFEYCCKNEIIISNSNINKSILEKKEYKLQDLDNDFIFNLISHNPYKDAINLSNMIYDKYSKYIVMSSFLKNKEIILSINNERIIKLQLLFLYDGELNNIKFDIINFKFNNKIYKLFYSDNLFELLHLSHKLYHPTNLLKLYKKNNLHHSDNDGIMTLYSQLLQSICKDSKGVEFDNQNTILEGLRKYFINAIHKDSYSKIQVVLLDTYAINMLNDFNKINYNDILHIIVNSNYLDLIIKIINDYIDLHLDKYKLVVKTNNLYILNDFRFKRRNITLVNKESGKKITLMYIYNSLDYEVIPTIKESNTIFVPHQLVIIRFLIINLYYMKLFDPSYNNSSYDKFIQKIKSLNFDDEFKKYNLINYIGIFIDERIDKFKFGSTIYRPWQYYIKNNKLQSI